MIRTCHPGCVGMRCASVTYESLPKNQILLIIAVQDTGIGIRPEDMGKLFDSFTRLEENRNRNIEGTGLGLNLTKKLVDMMGGEIFAESVYGKGSCFTAKIPQTIMSTDPIGDFNQRCQKLLHTSDKQDRSFVAKDAKILVVDDVKMNLKVMQGLLKKTGVQIDTAESGMACLENICKKQYDLIFLDHMMPELDGIETLQRMKQMPDHLNQDTPVIMLTANATRGAKEEYMQLGFTDYLTKPVKEDELVDMLAKYLKK